MSQDLTGGPPRPGDGTMRNLPTRCQSIRLMLPVLAFVAQLGFTQAQPSNPPHSIMVCPTYPAPLQLPPSVEAWLADPATFTPPFGLGPPQGGGGQCMQLFCSSATTVTWTALTPLASAGLPMWRMENGQPGLPPVVRMSDGSYKEYRECGFTFKPGYRPNENCFGMSPNVCPEHPLPVCWDDDNDGICTWSDPTEDLEAKLEEARINAGSNAAAVYQASLLHDIDGDGIVGVLDATPKGFTTPTAWPPGCVLPVPDSLGSFPAGGKWFSGIPEPVEINLFGLLPTDPAGFEAALRILLPGSLPPDANPQSFLGPLGSSQMDLAPPSGQFTVADVVAAAAQKLDTTKNSLNEAIQNFNQATVAITRGEHAEQVSALGRLGGLLADVLIGIHSKAEGPESEANSRREYLSFLFGLKEAIDTATSQVVGTQRVLNELAKQKVSGATGLPINHPDVVRILKAFEDQQALAFSGGAALKNLVIDNGTSVEVKIRAYDASGELQELGTFTILKQKPDLTTTAGDPVDVASGALIHECEDLHVPGRGVDLRITRHYSSLRQATGPFGVGWSAPLLDMRLIIGRYVGDDLIEMDRGDGTRSLFCKKTNANGESLWEGLLGEFGKMSLDRWPTKQCQVSGFWNYREPGGLVYRFGPPVYVPGAGGYMISWLMEVSDLHGNAIVFRRNQRGQVTSIVDTLHREYTLHYDPQRHLVTEITGPGGVQISYEYDQAAYSLPVPPNPPANSPPSQVWYRDTLLSVQKAPVEHVGVAGIGILTTGRPTEAYQWLEDPAGFVQKPWSILNNKIVSIARNFEAPLVEVTYGTNPQDLHTFGRVIGQTSLGGTTAFKYSTLPTPVQVDPYGQEAAFLTEMRAPEGVVSKFILGENRALLRKEVSVRRDNDGDFLPDGPSMEPFEWHVTKRVFDDDDRLLEEIVATDTSFTSGPRLRTELIYDFQNPDRLQQRNLLERRTFASLTGLGEPPVRIETFQYDPVSQQVSQFVDAGGRPFTAMYVHQEHALQTTQDLFGVAGFDLNLAGCSWGLGDLNLDLQAFPTIQLGGVLFGSVGLPARYDQPLVFEVPDLNASGAYRTPRHFVQYNEFGQVTGLKEDEKPWSLVTYTAGYPASSTLAIPTENHASIFTFDPMTGRLLSVAAPDGSVTSHQYDARGLRTISVKAPAPSGEPRNCIASETYYDLGGRPVGGRGPYFHSTGAVSYGASLAQDLDWVRSYDPLDRLLTESRIHRFEGSTQTSTTSSAYDSEGRLTASIGPTGIRVENTHDSVGNLVARWRWDSQGGPQGIWTYAFDPLGRLIREESPSPMGSTLGPVVTTHEYDGYGNLVASVRPDGGRTEFSYDPWDRVTVQVRKSPTGQVVAHSTTTYDSLDRPIDQSEGHFLIDGATGTVVPASPAFFQTLSGYGPHGQVTRVRVGDSGTMTRTDYDSHGRVVATWVGQDNLVGESIERDGLGRPHVLRTHRDHTSGSSAVSQQTVRSLWYGPYGWVEQTQDELGVDTLTRYNARGDEIFKTRLGHSLVTMRDNYGRERRVTEDGSLGVQRTHEKTWTILGHLATFTDAKGNQNELQYDALGRLAAKVHPDLSAEIFTYDIRDLLISHTTPGGVVRTHTYDTMGRLVELNAIGAMADVERRFLYDALDRPWSISEAVEGLPPVVHQQSRTSNGTLVEDDLFIDGLSDGRFTVSLDTTGRPSVLGWPSGLTIGLDYDTRGRPTNWTADVGTNLERPIAENAKPFGFDGYTEIDVAGGGSLSFTRNAGNQITRKLFTPASGTNRLGADYSWDLRGNLTAELAYPSESITSLGYDSLDRLTHFGSGGRVQTWAHDAADNWTTHTDTSLPAPVTPTTNSLNQCTSFGPWSSISYTGEGGESVRDAGGALFVVWGYDALDRPLGLVAMTSAGYVYTLNQYDPRDHIIRRTDLFGAEERYRYVDEELISLTKGGTTQDLFRGPFGIWRHRSAGPTDDFLFVDAFGNVTGVHDGAQVLESWSIDPYGLPRHSVTGTPLSSSTQDNSLFFQGAPYSSDTGLYHLGVRLFDPNLGRFLRRDPLGEAAGQNLYAYHLQNPYRFADPTGYGPTPAKEAGAGASKPGESLAVKLQNGATAIAEFGKISGYFGLRMGGGFGTLDLDVLTQFSYMNFDHGFGWGSLSFQEKRDLLWDSMHDPLTKQPEREVLHRLRTNLFKEELRELRWKQDLAILDLWSSAHDYATGGIVGGIKKVVKFGIKELGEKIGKKRVARRATGAFNPGSATNGNGLGRLSGREVRVSEKGLGKLESHLSQFGDHPQNTAMVGRLRTAMEQGRRVSGADASFYLHELSEATLMARGVGYEVAHAAALSKYGVSPFSVYAPEVIQSLPSYFSQGWSKFWGITK